MALPDMVQFAATRNSVLQSAAEAVAFRIAANGADRANKYQITRTTAVYLKDSNKYFVALDDDPAKNILLTKAQEGYDAHNSTGKWLVRKAEPLIRATLARAERDNRILPTPLEDTLQFATGASNGMSAYGTNLLVRATIGDLAAPYARFLNNQGYRTGYAWFLTPNDLQQLGVDEEHVEVRRVGVGGDDVNFNYLIADDRCDNYGRARGVRKP